jgi:pilus assembly protein CpaE
MESMYPLPVVLVGIDEANLSELREVLSLAEAEVESEFPSSETVLECLRRSKDRTRLLIVQLSDACDDMAIERLNRYFTGWPIMVLAPARVPSDQIEQVYRAGARQVVRLPLDGEDFQRALTPIAHQVVRGSGKRHVVAIAGVTGGCGATTLAINFAYEVAQRFHRSAILAELTLQVGALSSMLDLQPKITLLYLLREIHRVDDLLLEKALVPYAQGLKILAGLDQAGIAPRAELTHLARIIDGLGHLADVTVLDVPGTFNDADVGVLYAADQVILVGLQTVPSIRTLKLFCEMFPEERLNLSLWIAINRYNPNLKRCSSSEIKRMVGAPNVVPITNDYQSVSRAIDQGQPLRKAAPGTRILREIDGLIHSVLGVEAPAETRNGVLNRVLRSFQL